jgi:hypothetical protein
MEDVVALLCAVVPVRQTLRNIGVKSAAHLRQGLGLLSRQLDGDADVVGWFGHSRDPAVGGLVDLAEGDI